jgi:hypothetical protein
MKAHILYLWYVVRHKWFVGRMCFKMGIPLRGIIHDWSKFLPDEWGPYTEFFYTEKKNRNAFDTAWLKHQHRNPHHWQHWILKNDDGSTLALEMPELCAREMLCDWYGAGRAIVGPGSSTVEWYRKNREKMVLHPKTREFVEYALIVIDQPIRRPVIFAHK